MKRKAAHSSPSGPQPGTAQPSVKKTLKPRPTGFPFLQLPGEIKNKIYDLVVPQSHVLVVGSRPQKEYQQLLMVSKYRRQPKVQPYRLSGRILSIDDEESDPIGLMMSCRQIRDEVIPIFYSKTTPCFESLNTVNKFLDRAPSAGLKSLRSIRLKVNCYGEPKLTSNSKWKQKSDKKWSDTCTRLAAELVELQRVDIDLTMRTWPMTLGLHEDWARPLMTLSRNGLHLAQVKLRHRMFKEERLDMTAQRLENQMMSPEGREHRDFQQALQAIREMEERAKPKAKILVIKAPVSTQSKTSQKSKKQPPKPIYRTKGLAGYERIDLAMAHVKFIDCTKTKK